MNPIISTIRSALRRSGFDVVRFTGNAFGGNIPTPIPLINPIKKFAVFTNGKSGGSTIKLWFTQTLELTETASSASALVNNYGDFFALRWMLATEKTPYVDINIASKPIEDIRRFVDFYRHNYSVHHLDKIGKTDWHTFCVVRNPYDRVVSAFIDKFCGADREKIWVQDVIRRISPDKMQITFAEFIEFLDSVDIDKQDGHWSRQTRVIDGFSIDDFVRLENLADELSSISQKLTVKYDPSVFNLKVQSNKYGNLEHYSDLGCAHITNIDLLRTAAKVGSFPTKDLFWTDELRKAARRIYKRDFELLPYDP